jgi:hypothetical protein
MTCGSWVALVSGSYAMSKCGRRYVVRTRQHQTRNLQAAGEKEIGGNIRRNLHRLVTCSLVRSSVFAMSDRSSDLTVVAASSTRVSRTELQNFRSISSRPQLDAMYPTELSVVHNYEANLGIRVAAIYHHPVAAMGYSLGHRFHLATTTTSPFKP